MGYYPSGMFYLSKKGLPCSLHLRLSTPRFSIRITSTVLSDSILDFSPIHNCYLIVLQSVAPASTLYHNYIVFLNGCKIATWYFFEELGVVCTMGWCFFLFHRNGNGLTHTILCIYQIVQVSFSKVTSNLIFSYQGEPW